MPPSMGPSLGQNLQIGQYQIIAPRMIQSMEILQLPIMALQERIEQELEKNPVLELAESAPGEEGGDEEWRGSESTDGPAADPDGVLAHDPDGLQDFNRLESLNRDWDDWFDEEHRPSRSGIDEESERKHDAMQNMPSRPLTLQDHLLDQVNYLDVPEETAELMRYVIGYVDHTGYLGERYTVEKAGRKERARKRRDDGDGPAEDLPELEEVFRPLSAGELAARHEPPLDPEEVEYALSLVQKLDPPGVAARDHRECLLLQLQPDRPDYELMRTLVESHLDDIRHNRLPLIEEKTGYSIPAIKEGIEAMRGMTLRPGSSFAGQPAQYVTPDLAVERTDAGDYEVRLLDDWTPDLNISRYYQRLARTAEADQKTREYLRGKIQSARWLLEAIEQRKTTLRKVTRAIVDHQREFLDKGPEHIRPLKMQQIADQVGVHVTTVSRAVDDKWVQTPRGVFPLKRFFGGAAKNAAGEEVAAWETIKRELLKLIGEEDKQSPLSDEDLVAKLNDAGYPVARRTVTKYRKMLKIPSSRHRKSW